MHGVLAHARGQCIAHTRRPRGHEIGIEIRPGVVPALCPIHMPADERPHHIHRLHRCRQGIQRGCPLLRLMFQSNEANGGVLDLIHIVLRNPCRLPVNCRQQIFFHRFACRTQRTAHAARCRDINDALAPPSFECRLRLPDPFLLVCRDCSGRRDGGGRRRSRVLRRRSGRNRDGFRRQQLIHGQTEFLEHLPAQSGDVLNTVPCLPLLPTIAPDRQEAQEARSLLFILHDVLNEIAELVIDMRHAVVRARKMRVIHQEIHDDRLDHIADDVARRLLVFLQG